MTEMRNFGLFCVIVAALGYWYYDSGMSGLFANKNNNYGQSSPYAQKYIDYLAVQVPNMYKTGVMEDAVFTQIMFDIEAISQIDESDANAKQVKVGLLSSLVEKLRDNNLSAEENSAWRAYFTQYSAYIPH